MGISEVIYGWAILDNGTYEWKGADHNPRVMAYYVAAGHPEIKTDEVPWCAAFVGAKLAEVGLAGTGSLLARSYEKWGKSVDLSDAQRGDIVVLKRGNSTWQGHVGFFDRKEGGKVYLLGGNQRNQVNISGYAIGKIVAVRRAKEPRTNPVKSSTVQAVAVTAASGAGGVAAALGQLEPTAQYLVLGFCGVALIGLGWILRERLRKWAAGDR